MSWSDKGWMARRAGWKGHSCNDYSVYLHEVCAQWSLNDRQKGHFDKQWCMIPRHFTHSN
jgi:hypothetical protein